MLQPIEPRQWTVGESIQIHHLAFTISAVRHRGSNPRIALKDADGLEAFWEPGALLLAMSPDFPPPLGFFRHYEALKAGKKRFRLAGNVLDSWSALLPVQIVNEEIGDYIEDINRRITEGQRWGVVIRVAAAIFWTAVNAIGYFVQNALGRRKAG